MIPRKPIARISAKRLAANGGKVPFTTARRSPEPIRKVNPRRQARRKAGYRKLLSGKEYRAARAEALVRAGNRCEYAGHGFMRWLEGESIPISHRCSETDALHAHHIRYYHSRLITATDLQILCRPHHELAESRKMHKTRMF